MGLSLPTETASYTLENRLLYIYIENEAIYYRMLGIHELLMTFKQTLVLSFCYELILKSQTK